MNQFDLNQITADTNISQGQLNSRVSSDEEEESQTEVSECGSDDDKINNTSVTVTITIPHNNYDTDTTDDDDDSSSTDTYSSQTLTTITVNRKVMCHFSITMPHKIIFSVLVMRVRALCILTLIVMRYGMTATLIMRTLKLKMTVK